MTAAPSGFQFKLEGITRTVNAKWALEYWDSYDEKEYKTALRRGDYSTLNIYFLKSLIYNAQGFAYFPGPYSDPKSEEFIFDGVVNKYTTVPGGGDYYNGEGIVLIHEVGHWLGLLHT
jgi:hypothetical protein